MADKAVHQRLFGEEPSLTKNTTQSFDRGQSPVVIYSALYIPIPKGGVGSFVEERERSNVYRARQNECLWAAAV